MKLIIDDSLDTGTKLYRYMSLEQFLSLVETRQTYVTRVASWNDKWEAILYRLPTVDERGNRLKSINVLYWDIFGQCWSLLPESDALWRIYSANRTGVVISTSIEKFELVGGLELCHVARVIYFDGAAGLDKVRSSNRSGLRGALLKRSAFKHEEEVRLLTHIRHLPVPYSFEGLHVNLPLDPVSFIESITVDPRADEWFLETLKCYCARAGFTIVPVKSSLYEPDPHESIGLVQRWVPVDEEK